MRRSSRLALCTFCLLATGRVFAADTQPREFTVRATDGLHLACQESGEGDTALLFLHGWCGNHEYWKHQVDQFAGEYRIVTLDQAGHGRSGKIRTDWTMTALAADVQSVVDALKLQRVILIGHSMGGPVSLAAAPLLPGRVVAIIGVDTFHDAEYKWTEDDLAYIETLKTDFQNTVRGALKGSMPEDVDPELLAWILDGAAVQDQTMAVGLMTDMSRRDISALMATAKVPIRCINAAPTFGSAQPTKTDVNRKYADFDAVLIDKAGHYLMLEKPKEFNERLAEILSALNSKRRAES